MVRNSSKNQGLTGSLWGLVVAIQFLTRIPVPFTRNRAFTSDQFPVAGLWFPLVGLGLGLLLYGLHLGLERFFSQAVEAGLLLVISTGLSGGLHLDGLMDTADGLSGSQDPARSLAIMRDSRVGAMGVIAGCLVLLLKWVLLWDLCLINGELLGLILSLVLSRWAMVWAIYFFTPARADGLGNGFASGLKGSYFLGATLIALGVSVALLNSMGLLLVLEVCLVTSCVALWLNKRLGGLTGDTYGAINEINEVLVFLTIVGIGGQI